MTPHDSYWSTKWTDSRILKAFYVTTKKEGGSETEYKYYWRIFVQHYFQFYALKSTHWHSVYTIHNLVITTESCNIIFCWHAFASIWSENVEWQWCACTFTGCKENDETIYLIILTNIPFYFGLINVRFKMLTI